MRPLLKQFAFPLLVFYLIASIIWVINRVEFSSFIFLFFGLTLGFLALDVDHLIDWFYLHPKDETSQMAQTFVSHQQFRSLFQLYLHTYSRPQNLIFHHYFFQIVLNLISLFVFTSSQSLFTMGFLTGLNYHLIAHQIYDYQNHPVRLQNWLFARENKQLSAEYLKHYITVFVIIFFLFLLLLIRSQI